MRCVPPRLLAPTANCFVPWRSFIARNKLRARQLFRDSNKRILETQRSAQESIVELQVRASRAVVKKGRYGAPGF